MYGYFKMRITDENTREWYLLRDSFNSINVTTYYHVQYSMDSIRGI